MFDVPKLAAYALSQIEKFSRQHPDETFYAFAIDASMLCLNSVEEFEKALTEVSSKWPDLYNTIEDINKFKYGTGNWTYQGFASFRDLSTPDENGYPKGPFDDDLYHEHYNIDDDAQKTSEYAKAMDEVIEILKSRNAFQAFKKTTDFKIGRVEHGY